MPLTQPILNQKVSFDANFETVFTFQVIGGTQVTRNRLIIKNNVTLDVIYDSTVTSFLLQHTVPSGSLTNGVQYVATVQTGAIEDSVLVWSIPSQAIIFYCYTTPTLTFINIPTGNIIGNSSFNFEAIYNQIEQEKLNSYNFILYSFNSVKMSESGNMFIGNVEPPNNLSYLFQGFEDDEQYYIEVQGVTSGGTIISSGLVLFSVNYVAPNYYAVVSLENDCRRGWVHIQSNISIIDGKSNPVPPIYINDDTMVDIRGDGHWVRWDEGFVVNGNFTLSEFIYDPNVDSLLNILKTSSDTESSKRRIEIYYRHGYDGEDMMAYVELLCYDGLKFPYYIYSNYIDIPDPTDRLFLWVRRINNIFDLRLEKVV